MSTTTPSRHLKARPSVSHPPSTSSRIIKKLVLHGHAHLKGARYHLYLKVALPTTSSHQTYSLFPDTNIKLVNACVDPLTPSGGYEPLQESAARAAGYLGIPMSSDSTTALDAPPLPRVTIANYAVALSVPVLHPQQGTSTLGYIVSLEVETTLAAKPPRSPFTLHLPVPRCLHSRIHFTFPPEVMDFDQEVQVRVEPPLGPRLRKGRKSIDTGDEDAKSSTTVFSEDSNEVDDGEEGEEDDLVVRGLFPSTDLITLHWNEVGAGKLHPDDDVPALMCDAALSECDVSYSLLQDDTSSEYVNLDVQLKTRLTAPFSPGAGSPLCFPFVLESFKQDVKCFDVEVRPVRGLRSWRLVSDDDNANRSGPSKSLSNRNSVASLTSLSEDDSDNTMDLLATRPPRGLDVSLDLTADTTIPQSPLSPDKTTHGFQAIVLYLDDSIFREHEHEDTWSIIISCRLTVPFSQSNDYHISRIPIFRTPTAFSQQTTIRVKPAADMNIPLYASQSPHPSGLFRPTSLEYQVSFTQDQESLASLETCYVHRFETKENSDDALQIDIAPATDAPSPTTPVSSGRVVRPMPLYDAITLHDDGSSLPSTITSLSLSIWICSQISVDGGQTATPLRFLAQMESSWPAMHDGRQLDEVDLWLPRLEKQSEVVVRYVEVDGRRIEPTRSDAGESICLHIRKPEVLSSEHEEVNREALFARKLLIIFEYPPISTLDQEDKSASPTSKTTTTSLPLPIPLFSQEVITIQVEIHHPHTHPSTAHTSSNTSIILAPTFDFIRIDPSGSAPTKLQKFNVSALTPLEVCFIQQKRSPPFSLSPTPGLLNQIRFAPRQTQIGTLSHWLFLFSFSLAFLSLWNALQVQHGEVLSLSRKVEQLGYATNVDFREAEGSWREEEEEEEDGSGGMMMMMMTRQSEESLDGSFPFTVVEDPSTESSSDQDKALLPLPLRPSSRSSSSSSEALLQFFFWPLRILRRGAVRIWGVFV